jgi:hypothetical protein
LGAFGPWIEVDTVGFRGVSGVFAEVSPLHVSNGRVVVAIAVVGAALFKALEERYAGAICIILTGIAAGLLSFYDFARYSDEIRKDGDPGIGIGWGLYPVLVACGSLVIAGISWPSRVTPTRNESRSRTAAKTRSRTSQAQLLTPLSLS